MADILEVKEFESPDEKLGLRIERVLDETPDLSWMGEYSNTWEEGAIDRQEEGDWERHELRYWIPGPNHFPHNPKNWAHVSAAGKKKVIKEFGSIRKADEAYVRRDYERMEAFNRGDWGMIGIIVQILDGPFKEVGNASLFGTESDSGEEYLQSLEKELIAEAEAEAGLDPVDWEEI